MTGPCKDCPDRLVTPEFNCHSECTYYQDFTRRKQRQYMERLAESQVAGFRKASIERMKKRIGK